MSGFVHLHVHTEFSLADSTIRVPEKPEQADPAKAKQPNLLSRAVELGLPALAVTDLNNLFALIKFYKAAEAVGIKPIAGADLAVAAGPGEAPWRLTALCRDHRGYLNLSRLLTRAWMEGHRAEGGVVVTPAWIKDCGEGLVLLAGRESLAGRLAAEHRHDLAEQQLADWQRAFDGNLCLELVRTGRDGEEAFNAFALHASAARGIPVVASNDVRFLDKSGFDAHEARVCIASGRVLDDPKRPRDYSDEQYLKSAEEMAELFADVPDAIANTVELARRCNLELTLGKYALPAYPVPSDETLDSWIRKQAHDGLEARLAKNPLAEGKTRQDYVERLDFELDTICKMGFPGYFLIVADFIQWGKNHGIPIGPGRGSGAGSLVAWALQITDLDPIPYNLLFERFLNPERVSMPDFDIDFCMDRRDEVIDYVAARYGRERVSQIITYGTMAAKAVVRDSGRVLGFPYGFVDGVAKLIPNILGISLKDAMGEGKDSEMRSDELIQRYGAEEDVRDLIDMARQLEDLTRNAGKHAGGVVIAPEPLHTFCPLFAEHDQDGLGRNPVTQFDKDDVEAIGLVKFDFLGLRTLTIIDWAVKAINVRHARAGIPPLDIAALPLDDAATYRDVFANGNTGAVFQFESAGMRRALKEARPDRFEDLIALNALYRPGPMEMIPSFVARKHGQEEFAYPDPRTRAMLEETYGIMVYQEQVMQMAQIVGGYSLGGADLLRRAMGKKVPAEMAKHREIFRQGAAAGGVGEGKADEIFDLMEKFAGYGFNKSHAAAYSLLAYHTAWLKVHYTAEFYCANMTVEMDNTDKLKVLYEDAQREGMRFEPPDINRGSHRFEPVSDTLIRYGLGAIKGTGQQAIEAIVAAREGRGAGPAGGERGPFKSLFDFCRRIDRTRVNKRTVEALIRAGALDTLHMNRAALAASIDLAFDFAAASEANANQGGLFDLLDDAHGSSSQEPELPSVTPWGIKERLSLEKTAIGFYLSGHLFDEVEREVRQFVRRSVAELTDSREPQLLAGIVGDLRVINGQRGKLALFRLDDKSGVIDARAEESLIQRHRHTLKDDEFIVVMGKVMPDRFSGGLQLNVTQVWDLAQARCRFGKFLRVAVSGKAPEVRRLLAEYPPQVEHTEHGELLRGLPVRLLLERRGPEGGAMAQLHLGDQAQFFPSDAALASWVAQADEGRAMVVYE